jgi:hypothetical protein
VEPVPPEDFERPEPEPTEVFEGLELPVETLPPVPELVPPEEPDPLAALLPPAEVAPPDVIDACPLELSLNALLPELDDDPTPLQALSRAATARTPMAAVARAG